MEMLGNIKYLQSFTLPTSKWLMAIDSDNFTAFVYDGIYFTLCLGMFVKSS
uniref:Uncharacterized protein n=1 Tax=Rhizophora mucronata TaxID=61149 RepID=A0A2P2IKK0_RHIMU